MYQLQELPYNYQDFEPYIDTHTLGLHYNKHQKTYLNNLNKLLQKNNYNYKCICYNCYYSFWHIIQKRQ